MPYIGKEPVAGNFVLLDSITTSATATYALTKDSVAYSPESARNMIVSLNGVTQAPESAFTVSGSNITFSSALTSSDVIDYILVLGDVLSVGTPSDGTVGTSQMSYPLGNFSSTGIDDNATSTAITIDASENVGIGTTSPSYLVDARTASGNAQIHLRSGGDLAQLLLISNDTTGTSQINFGDADSNNIGLITYTHNLNAFRFTVNSAEAMRIDSSGNVGIGTTSPSSFNQVGADTLVVGSGSGEQGITIYSGTANNGVLAFADGTTTTQQYEGYIGYNHSSTFMRFFTGATERMRIDSVGSMGLGTAGAPNTLSSNATTLNIKGSVTTKTGAIWLQSSDESLSSYLYQDSTNLTLGTLSNHNLRFVTNNSERARIDTSGRLLLGTSSSISVTGGERQFQISGTNGVTSSAVIRRSQNSSGAPSLSFAKDRGSVSTAVADGDALGAIYFAGSDGTDLTNDAASIIGSADGTPSSNNTPGRLAFYTNGGSVSSTERMRIDSSGNIGIGITNPQRTLHINGGATRTDVQLTLDGLGVTNSDGVQFGILSTGAYIWNFENSILYFATNNTERMRILSSGAFCVGKTSVGSASTGGFSADQGQIQAIYTGTAPAALFGRGSNGLGLDFYVAGTDAGGVTFTQSGTPAFAAASDERLKENITEHESELANVMALRPVRWDWKDKNRGAGEGFVAQELEQTAWADLVSEGEDGYKMVSGLGAVETRLIKALQEQQAMIEELKAEVAALKGA